MVMGSMDDCTQEEHHTMAKQTITLKKAIMITELLELVVLKELTAHCLFYFICFLGLISCLAEFVYISDLLQYYRMNSLCYINYINQITLTK